MKWLAECSVAALREALEAVAPELSRFPVTVPGPAGKEDPQWHSGCVPVTDQFFVKFAWSHPAALQLAREIGVLAALARGPAVPFLPEVVASSTAPLLLITRRVPGASLFEVADSTNPDPAARQLVRFRAGSRPGAADRDHAPLPAGHRTAAVGRPAHGLASAPGPLRHAVAQRSRHPAERPPHATGVGRRPGRALQRARHRPRKRWSPLVR